MITINDLKQMLNDARKAKGRCTDPAEKKRLEVECSTLQAKIKQMSR